MSEANKVQIGGTHYKTSYEHWDLVAEVGMNYFTGNATKYAARWRKKNGKEDLEKALHYLNKFAEVLTEYDEDLMENTPEEEEAITAEVEKFARTNQLWEDEHAIVLRLSLLRDWDDLNVARETIKKLIGYALQAANQPGKLDVPKTDSNKHAFQE